MKIQTQLVAMSLFFLHVGCTISPEQCSPLIPDTTLNKALVCWVTGNTQKNIENMRLEVNTLADNVELQDIALRQISTSSEIMSNNIAEYEKYLAVTEKEISGLKSVITSVNAQTERQVVARQALLLELDDISQRLTNAKTPKKPALDEITQLQLEIAKKRSAVETMNQVLLE